MSLFDKIRSALVYIIAGTLDVWGFLTEHGTETVQISAILASAAAIVLAFLQALRTKYKKQNDILDRKIKEEQFKIETLRRKIVEQEYGTKKIETLNKLKNGN